MTEKRTVLTGITTTGTPHLGNYVGAIRPAVEASRSDQNDSYYFLADYHALIKCQEPERVHQSTKEIAATWLALGIDTDKTTFYRQSDVPEITELTWMLTCMTAKGLMNRAHAYKAAVQENRDAGDQDDDKAITMGLFSYPVLMTADILMFNAHDVPVGKDQIQHIEMARVIAQRFNHHYGDHFVLPEAVIGEDASILPGLDGRKMSKSYNNTIPLWLPEKKLRKHVMKIKTNSLEPGEPKSTEGSALFDIYKAVVGETESQQLAKLYAEGIAWGAAKQMVFERINDELKGPRARYEELMSHPQEIENELLKGALKARDYATPFMHKLRKAVGIYPLV
ncbi:MAG: tryptophan--tRNA ligase [bacterium]